MRDAASQGMADQPAGIVAITGDGTADSATPVSAVIGYVRQLTLRKIAELLASIVMSLVVAELAIGWLNPQEEIMQKDVMVPDSALDFRMLPNYRGTMSKKAVPLATNSWGLRDREYGPPADGTLRLYVLGDSMVFGYGVRIEETFPRGLEELLQQRLGRKVEAVNGGVPGYGTLQELGFFEHTVAQVKPDIVLVAVAVLNDIADNIKFSKRGWGGRSGVLEPFNRARAWVRQHSQLYLLLHRRLAAPSGADVMQIHAVAPAAILERGLRLTEESLARFAAAAQSHQAAFAVVIIPAHKQVSPVVWAETLRKYRLPADTYTPDQPDASLTAAAQREGIAVLDLRQVLQAHWQEPIYWDGDGEHWETRGHALVAEAIAEFLVQNRLVSAPAASVAAQAPAARPAQ